MHKTNGLSKFLALVLDKNGKIQWSEICEYNLWNKFSSHCVEADQTEMSPCICLFYSILCEKGLPWTGFRLTEESFRRVI